MAKKLDPIHPGEILFKEFMEPMGVSINRLASDIDVPISRISVIVNRKRGITPDTAMRLAVYFGNTPKFWMNLQGDYDLEMVRRKDWPAAAARIRPNPARSAAA